MVKKRKPLRLARGEEEMIRAIRECLGRDWAFGFSAMMRLWWVCDSDLRQHNGEALPAALKKAKDAEKDAMR